MNYITDPLHQEPQYQALLEAARGDVKSIYLHGLVRESTGHVAASLFEDLKRPVFLVSETPKRAQELADAIGALLPGKVEFLSEKSVNFYETDALIEKSSAQRLRVLSRLSRNEVIFVVCTAGALLRKVTPKKTLQKSVVTLYLDSEIDRDALVLQLTDMMYERVPSVESKGQFAVRGGIVDVYPPNADLPIRLELFDTVIDSMRTFEIGSQRSIDHIEKVELYPAEELQIHAADRKRIAEGIRKDLRAAEKHPAYGRDDAKASEKFGRILERLELGERISNTDLLSPYLAKEHTANILDYLPDDGVVLMEDISRIYDDTSQIEEMYLEQITSEIEQGVILKTHQKTFYTLQEVLERIRKHTTINITQLLKRMRVLGTDKLFQLKTVEVERFERRWDAMLDRIHQRQEQGYRILILAGESAEGVGERLRDAEVAFHVPSSIEEVIEPGQIFVSDRQYPHGFRYPDYRFLILTEHEITGKEQRTKRRAKPMKKRDFINYQDLVVGDYVVHENYGIGRYAGTKSMEVNAVTKDFLQIEYKGRDMLYIPTDEMNLIAKFIGAEGKEPKLSKLGGYEWTAQKTRVQKAVEEIADELVELYAQRAEIVGHAFGPDQPWQKEFEDAFPYEETYSQLRATEEIKRDMESNKPMDRLLCGDVGYGKTEVALRAAFKAILDGKQVCFLCPTTILTQQHYATMIDRFQDFGVTVEFLSRFKSAAQQREVLKRLKRGEVDIVVGTHRLLSKDVRFHDLGLLIVDEEQRFGVKDKEKIKQIKKDVDVLTLSATPIPRTLQLSLTGIRDMSILEEPPEERSPITTFVMEYEPKMIEAAIRKEIGRGGQVYFVYNRVHDIDRMEAHIHELVPEATTAVAHGKLPVHELENIMEAFIEGHIDVLLSTTIIETGMDIQNVNTMIVYNADHMGLSQLYQLKGRIGRSDRNSVAYFTYEKNKVLSEISEKRLKAIKDFTEFGSGYKIAMRDLELRGAGNLLGESQSGHIESIGYDLYVKMLEEAVMHVKGGTKQLWDEREIKVDIKVDAFIPSSYIVEQADKMAIYRTIASIGNEEDYRSLIDELLDRFGDIPKSVLNIMDVALLKKMATRLGFEQVKEIDGFVELRYDDFERFPVEMLKAISEQCHGPLTFDFQNQPKFKIASTPEKMADVLGLLRTMSQIQETFALEDKLA